MSNAFDYAKARGTLRVLQLAHDRWRDVFSQLDGMKFDDLNGREEVAHIIRGPAVEFLMWARGLDDFCRGMPERRNGKLTPTQPYLAGYEAARSSVEGLVDGARYATNREVHQLLALMEPKGAMRFPMSFPLAFDHFGGVRWLHEVHLPAVDEERSGQLQLRQAYVDHLAGQKVGPTLDDLRAWFEGQLT
ncbi:hypothetical protein [Amycolatopsis methanolica]|uniref:Uncharacterized protein n=1 Tax=Amycolatopsis methanolica 239 TaxID=1068978 RepID=A0A076MRH2_AMYME|nr:hypothetical protein [Amycolatopsis methanolica]AIJ23239.1 hypothetical protein AMETH_3147 [Amycolatopsis methanolica 239]